MTTHKVAERTGLPLGVKIRTYRREDLRGMLWVFHEAVHRSCAGAYSPEQLAAWVPETLDEEAWARRFEGSQTRVAVDARGGGGGLREPGGRGVSGLPVRGAGSAGAWRRLGVVRGTGGVGVG